jgi:molecular chaperone DnaK
VTMTDSTGLSKEEIERMVNEANLHAEEDKKQKEVVEQRNKLDHLTMQIEKSLKDNKEKLSAEEISATENALASAQSVLKDASSDLAALKKASDDLIAASHKIAEILYNESQAAAGDVKPTPDENGAIDIDGGESQSK